MQIKAYRQRWFWRVGLLWILGLTGWHVQVQAQVGAWRYHFAATPPEQVAIWGSEVYASRVADLLCYNTLDHTLTTVSKRQGLSGGEIGAIACHEAANCLVIGYKDGNIDLYYGGDVFNMSDIKDKTIAGGNDKTIYRIHTQGPYAYLACGFGIVVLNVVKREFSETYFIGDLNGSLRVNEVNGDERYLWAATEQGLRFADKNAVNLNDYTAWTVDAFWGQSHALARVVKAGDTWWVLEEGEAGAADKVYRGRLGGEWVLEDTTDIKAVSCLVASEGHVLRGAYRTSTGLWAVDVLSETGELQYQALMDLGRDYDGSIPNDACLDARHNVWTVGTWESLKRFEPGQTRHQSFYYWGPAFNAAMTMTGKGNVVYVAGGGYDASYGPIFRNGTVSVFDGKEWKFMNRNNVEGFADWSATVQILADPAEAGHYFLASAVKGLMEVRDNKVVHWFTDTNSPLQAYGDYVRVYGIALDADGDVWMTNPGSSTALLEYRHDGTWQAYDISEFSDGLRLGAVMVDYWQHVWVIDRRDNVYVFEADGPHIQGLQIDENNGSTVNTSRVLAMIEDEVGHVWLGTERGIKLIDRHAELFDHPNGRYSSVECKNIMVPSGDYIIELLRNEGVTSLVRDGANRKWIGTESDGLFLVSADGTQELAHYTAENSGLLADQVNVVGIIPYTGEVLVATTGGICSYMGTGAFKEEGASVLPYPNPVPPGYEGYISIRNLPADVEVKITDAAGHLIYEGRATGSQLSWNGYNMQGKRPQSGVLLVFAANSAGKDRLVCKIFYAR